MTIKELCKKAHQIAKEHGFWDTKNPNISEKLMLIITELGEACEALRKNNRQNYEPTYTIQDMFCNGRLHRIWHKDSFEDEICDVFIRLGDLCEALDIDIEWQIKKKMEYNQSRPYKHGKKF